MMKKMAGSPTLQAVAVAPVDGCAHSPGGIHVSLYNLIDDKKLPRICKLSNNTILRVNARLSTHYYYRCTTEGGEKRGLFIVYTDFSYIPGTFFDLGVQSDQNTRLKNKNYQLLYLVLGTG